MEKKTDDIEGYIREKTGEFNDEMFLQTVKEHYAKAGLTMKLCDPLHAQPWIRE